MNTSNDFLGWVSSLAGCVAVMGMVERASMAGYITRGVARKLMHVGTAVGFVLTWPLYSDSTIAPWVAASVPALASCHVLAVGLGCINDKNLIAGASRTGSAAELLRGPLMFGVSIVAATVCFWRTSHIGITAIMALGVGDAAAEVVGSRMGGCLGLWPHCRRKSLAGSLACFICTAAASYWMLTWFQSQGFITTNELPQQALLRWCATSAITGAFVESLPVTDWDNVTVPLSVVLLGLSDISL